MTNQEIKNKVTNHLKNNLFFTFLNYKIDYAVGMSLAEIVYDGYFAGERNMSEMSKKNLKSKIDALPISDDQKEKFYKDFISLYKRDLYNRMSYYIHAAINNLKLQNITVSPYHNSYGAVAANSAIYKFETKKTKQLRENFIKSFSS